jgi:hypothetical protein
MSPEETISEDTKKPNYILWGCLAAIGLFLVISCCLISVAGFAIFSNVDLFGLGTDGWFDDYLPFQDFLEEPSLDLDSPDYYDEEEIDEGEDSGVSTEPGPISGITQMTQFQSDQFSFVFFYPEGWDGSEDENNESVVFLDPDSNTFLGVGRDWLCQGCSTAKEVSDHFLVDIEFDAEPGSLVVLEDMPYSVSTGEDAHFGAYEWTNLEGDYQWIYDLVIYDEDPVEDTTIYFVLWGDDYEFYEEYRELFEKVIRSYSK